MIKNITISPKIPVSHPVVDRFGRSSRSWCYAGVYGCSSFILEDVVVTGQHVMHGVVAYGSACLATCVDVKIQERHSESKSGALAQNGGIIVFKGRDNVIEKVQLDAMDINTPTPSTDWHSLVNLLLKFITKTVIEHMDAPLIMAIYLNINIFIWDRTPVQRTVETMFVEIGDWQKNLNFHCLHLGTAAQQPAPPNENWATEFKKNLRGSSQCGWYRCRFIIATRCSGSNTATRFASVSLIFSFFILIVVTCVASIHVSHCCVFVYFSLLCIVTIKPALYLHSLRCSWHKPSSPRISTQLAQSIEVVSVRCWCKS